MSKKEGTEIGQAPIMHTGQSLYFTMEGGTFEAQDGLKGTFAMTAGGGAIIVYIGDESYECRAEDVIQAAISHYRKNKEAA